MLIAYIVLNIPVSTFLGFINPKATVYDKISQHYSSLFLTHYRNGYTFKTRHRLNLNDKETPRKMQKLIK